jgi:hypothetical protein
MNVHMHAYMHTYMQTCQCVFKVHKYIRVIVCIYRDVGMYVCFVCVCKMFQYVHVRVGQMCVYLHTRMCVYLHTRIHTYIHTYIQTDAEKLKAYANTALNIHTYTHTYRCGKARGICKHSLEQPRSERRTCGA